MLQELPRGVKSVQVRHANVDDHHVGVQLQGLFNALPAIAGLPADLPTFMLFQESAQPPAYNFMIVCQENSQFHSLPLPRAQLNRQRCLTYVRVTSFVESRERSVLAHSFYGGQQITSSVGLYNVAASARFQRFTHHLRRIMLGNEQD